MISQSFLLKTETFSEKILKSFAVLNTAFIGGAGDLNDRKCKLHLSVSFQQFAFFTLVTGQARCFNSYDLVMLPRVVEMLNSSVEIDR